MWLCLVRYGCQAAIRRGNDQIMRISRLTILTVTAILLIVIFGAGAVALDTGISRGQDGASSGLFLPLISIDRDAPESGRTATPTPLHATTLTVTPKPNQTLQPTSTSGMFPTVTNTPSGGGTQPPTTPSGTATPSGNVQPTQMPTNSPSPAATATQTPMNSPSPVATATHTPTASGTAARLPQVLVGPGYTDVSPKALVRTAGDRLYGGVSTCDAYPCDSTAQTVRIYRANNIGIPAGFTRQDSNNEPTGIAQWAVAIDGSDTIHVVFNTRSSTAGPVTALKYATFDTSTNRWSSVETIDSTISFSQDSGGQGVQSVALALDSNGAPHVAYLAGTNRRTMYRNKIGGTWGSALQVDSDVSYTGNMKAWHPNLAFDKQGRIIVAWERGTFNGANDGTIFVKMRSATGSWGNSMNLSGNTAARTIIDQSTSLLVTDDNRYHITWISAPDDYIQYQYSDDKGATWQANHPANGLQVTHNPSLGPDGRGGIRIYGHGTPDPHPDGHGDNLYYFEGAGGAANWSSYTLYVTGALDSSVNTRWSQYFHHSPTLLDIAYWDDAYPNILYVGSESVVP